MGYMGGGGTGVISPATEEIEILSYLRVNAI